MNKKQTTIRLPVELKDKLQHLADTKGISFNACLIIMLEKGLSRD